MRISLIRICVRVRVANTSRWRKCRCPVKESMRRPLHEEAERAGRVAAQSSAWVVNGLL